MINLRFHPLTEWPAKPTPTYKRKSRVSFSASWNQTLTLLEDELLKLKAQDVVVSAALRPEDIRIDGWPRSGANPSQPGIILSFASSQGPLRYLTDRYEFWQHNLRAIALGLQALRAVDRYGITERGEQYVGWKAIPASTGNGEAPKELLHRVSGLGGSLGGVEPGTLYRKALIAAHRKALIAAHPDHGGSRELLEAVQDAARKLGVA